MDAPSPNATCLDAVLADPRVWRGRRSAASATTDGLPDAALTEVFVPVAGIGELGVLLPALVARQAHGLIALIAPPHIPYAPALVAAGLDLERLLVVHASSAREGCWAMEQALRDGSCGAVVAWFDDARLSFAALRRLQLAAETGACTGVAFRAWRERRSASPAALRLALAASAPPKGGAATAHGPRATVLKRRGGGGFAVAQPRSR